MVLAFFKEIIILNSLMVVGSSVNRKHCETLQCTDRNPNWPLHSLLQGWAVHWGCIMDKLVEYQWPVTRFCQSIVFSLHLCNSVRDLASKACGPKRRWPWCIRSAWALPAVIRASWAYFVVKMFNCLLWPVLSRHLSDPGEEESTNVPIQIGTREETEESI